MFSPTLIAVAAAAAFGVGDFLAHRFAKDADGLETFLWIGVLGFVLLTPFAIVDVLKTSAHDLLFLSGIGALGFIAGVTIYTAYNRAQLSVAELVLQLEIPITVGLGVLLFGETLSAITIGAIIALLIGLYLVTGAHLRDIRARSGIILAAVGAILLGVVNYLTAVGARTTSSLVTNWVLNTVILVLVVAVLLAQGRVVKTFARIKSQPLLIIAFSTIDTIAWVLYAQALRVGTLSITGAIVQGYPVVAVWLAVRFNNDTLSWRQWCGVAAVVIAGIALAL